jgi:hypothetical protein
LRLPPIKAHHGVVDNEGDIDGDAMGFMHLINQSLDGLVRIYASQDV